MKKNLWHYHYFYRDLEFKLLFLQNEDSKIFMTNVLTAACKEGVQGTKMGLYASVDGK